MREEEIHQIIADLKRGKRILILASALSFSIGLVLCALHTMWWLLLFGPLTIGFIKDLIHAGKREEARRKELENLDR